MIVLFWKGQIRNQETDRDVAALPSISLIVTYYKEPRSTLLRTLVSVYERTPSYLLKEIILVDDNNEDKTVGKELQVLYNTSKMKRCHVKLSFYWF